MFYDKTAYTYKKESISDGMGGQLDAEPTLISELTVVSAPVTAELMLKQYGVVSTTSLKMYTENSLPEGDFYIKFNDEDYRVLQLSNYGKEEILLLELI